MKKLDIWNSEVDSMQKISKTRTSIFQQGTADILLLRSE